MKNKLEGLHLSLLKKTISYKGYNLLFLSQVFIAEHFTGSISTFTVSNLTKKVSLENLTKYIFYKLKGRKLGSEALSREYLFVNEVNNKPVIETLHHVQDQFKGYSACELISDHRLMGETPRLNIFQFAGPGIFFKTLLDSLRLLPQLYTKRKELKEIAREHGIGQLFLVLNCFDSIFLINLVERMLHRMRVNKIIMISDVHKLSRIITLHAAARQIPTFVLQHGATVGDFGYLPVLADSMLAWGDLSRKWFIDRGQEAGKITVVGSPRMDAVMYPGEQQNTVITTTPRSILVVMSEVLHEKGFLELIRDAFVSLNIPGAEISIKLHPAGSVDHTGMVEKVFSGSGLNFKVYRAYNLKELLLKSDLVFVTTSSVGMEAIIFNKPLLQFKVDKFSYVKMSFEEYDCSYIFKTSADIVNVISDPAILKARLKNYSVFVKDYFFRLDGKSSLRAKEFIENYQKK